MDVVCTDLAPLEQYFVVVEGWRTVDKKIVDFRFRLFFAFSFDHTSYPKVRNHPVEMKVRNHPGRAEG